LADRFIKTNEVAGQDERPFLAVGKEQRMGEQGVTDFKALPLEVRAIAAHFEPKGRRDFRPASPGKALG
jgi:hypothetical protein